MRITSIARYLLLSILGMLPASTASAQVDITTWQVNQQHWGLNSSETILTPGAVQTPQAFGLLYTQQTDGQTYGQPLFMSMATLNTLPGSFRDQNPHNVVYVATQSGSLFAFDADVASAAPLWQASLIPAGKTPITKDDVQSGDILGNLAVTTTPVIDPSTSTIYIVSTVKDAGSAQPSYHQYLYALDLKTGQTKTSPLLIQPTFPGIPLPLSPTDKDQVTAPAGQIPFSALHEHLRAAMTLSKGILYLVYASHSDEPPYYGEILGYDVSSFPAKLVKTFITNTNGTDQGDGIWQSGAAPAFDSNGNLYVMTGNGPFDQIPDGNGKVNQNDWGESVLRLSTNSTQMEIPLLFSDTTSWFTPQNWKQLNDGDANNRPDMDLGGGGLLLLPDQTGGSHPHIMVGGGKAGTLYVLDRDNLSGLNPEDQSIQEIIEPSGSGFFATPAYFNGNIYYALDMGHLEQRQVQFDPTTGHYVSDSMISSTDTFSDKGATVFISSNGNSNGIVWLVNNGDFRVYNAANVQNSIFGTTATVPGSNGDRCTTAKFTTPIVANGKVYFTCFTPDGNTGFLFVYGLLPLQPGQPATPINVTAVANSSTQVTVSWTAGTGTGASGYQVNRAPTTNGPWTTLSSTISASQTVFQDTSATPDTTYFYQVIALASPTFPNSNTSLPAQVTTFPAPTQPGLVAYWNMDDGTKTSNNSTTGISGTVTDVFDVTGNGHLGESTSEALPVGAGYINGGWAIHGTGSGGRIQVNSTPDIQFAANQSFTLSAWVFLTGLPKNGGEFAIIAKSVDQGNPYGIWVNRANQWVARGPNGDIVGPTAVENVWTNVTVVQDGIAGTRTLYVNGTAAPNNAPAQPADGAGQLWMGAQNATNDDGAEAVIDEVRLYNIALAPNAVTQVLAPPVIDVVSNQTQGNGTFGVTLFPAPVPLTEPRLGSTAGTYNLSIRFDAPVTGVTATLGVQPGVTQPAVGQVASVTMDSTNTIANVVLTGVQNVQALNLHLANVTPIATAGVLPIPGTSDIPFNILQGDVTGDRVVDTADVTAVTANFTGAVTLLTAIYDLNGDGVVDSKDVQLVTALGTPVTSLNVTGDVNLAQYKNAIASSVEGGNTANLAFDNDPTFQTRWESLHLDQSGGQDPQWIYVDLGATATIHSITLDWENAAGQNYDLQVSNDQVQPGQSPVNWTTVQTVVNNNSPGLKIYSGLNATGRYVRMFGHSRDTGFGYSLFDFQVLGSFAGAGTSTGTGSGTVTPPSITSVLTQTAIVQAPFNYQILATQNPTSFTAAPLPQGLTLNATTGLISGAPSAAAVGINTVNLSASNASGQPGTAVLTITVSPASPGSPTAIAGIGQVTLNWVASPGATSYSVFRGATAGGEAATPLTTTTGTTFTDTNNLTAGTTYFYTVVAVNPAANVSSAPSIEVSATPTAAPQPPATPANLTAIAGNAQITLDWNAVAGATSYNVLRSTTSGGETTGSAIQQAATSNSFIDNSNLTNGTTYFYQVQAVNSTNGLTSNLSNEASATPAAPQTSTGSVVYQIAAGDSMPVPPFSADEFVSGGNASGATNDTINLAGVSNPAPMHVYQGNRFGSFIYTLPGLIPGDSYTVRLHFAETFQNAGGKRRFNVAINGTTVLTNFDIFCTATGDPINCTGNGKDIAVVQTFTANANSQGQIVLAFTNGSADNPQVNGIEVLTNGGAMPPPAAPAALMSTPGLGQVSLSWNPGNGPTGTYNVYRSTVSGGEAGTTPINPAPLTGTHFIDTNKLTNGTTYFYTVVATSAGASSTPSNEVSAVPGASVVGTPIYQVASGTTATDAATIAAISPFVDDNFFNGGGTSGNGNNIDTTHVVSPAPARVYQGERSGGTFTYQFPNLTPGAKYTVRLHFAETFFQAAGQRVFNVAINSIPVLQNFDIFATAGAANTAVIEQFTATADASGMITITYSQGPSDQPKSSAVEIYQ